jgi:predicted DNA-binding antitoxin AbrB/MazE fold protein
MTVTIEAVYENGVLRPAQPLTLAEGQKVRLTVHDERSVADRTYGMIKWTGSHEELEEFLNDPDNGIWGDR